MPPIEPDQPLMPSLLTRLQDDAGSSRGEHSLSPHQVLRELKQSVRADLEKLLNTRWRCTSWPPGLDELEQSLVNYGIPDFTGANFSDPVARRDFTRILERVIQRFEPRFKSIRVVLLDKTEPTDRTLHFRFDAVMYAEPVPEPIVFESVLEPATATFQVKRSGR